MARLRSIGMRIGTVVAAGLLAAVGILPAAPPIGGGVASAGPAPEEFFVNNNSKSAPNPDAAKNSCKVPDYDTIQEAVANATPFSEIKVCASRVRYQGPIDIGLPLILRGVKGRPTIEPGPIKTGPNGKGDGQYIIAVGAFFRPAGEGGDDVDIRNLKLRGPFQSCGANAGLLVTNGAPVQVREVRARHMLSEVCGNGVIPDGSVAMEVDNGAHLEVRNSRISRYGEVGILVIGGENGAESCKDCLAPPRERSSRKNRSRVGPNGFDGTSADIRRTIIRGLGETNKFNFQAGVLVVGEGAEATISDNTRIQRNRFASQVANAFGVLVESGSAATVIDSTFDDNDVHVAIGGALLRPAGPPAPIPPSTVENNQMDDANYYAIWLFGGSAGAQVADNDIDDSNVNGIRIENSIDATVVDNEITDTGAGDDGLDIREINSENIFYNNNDCDSSIPDSACDD